MIGQRFEVAVFLSEEKFSLGIVIKRKNAESLKTGTPISNATCAAQPMRTSRLCLRLAVREVHDPIARNSHATNQPCFHAHYARNTWFYKAVPTDNSMTSLAISPQST